MNTFNPGGRFNVFQDNQTPSINVPQATTFKESNVPQQTFSDVGQYLINSEELKQSMIYTISNVFMKFGVNDQNMRDNIKVSGQVYDFIDLFVTRFNIFTFASLEQLNEVKDIVFSDETYIALVNDLKAITFFNLGLNEENYLAFINTISFQCGYNTPQSGHYIIPDQLQKRLVSTEQFQSILVDNTWLIPLLLVAITLSPVDLNMILLNVSDRNKLPRVK